MTKILIALSALIVTSSATAQWAVYDDQVKQQLVKINNVKSIGDKKLSEFDKQAILSEKFETKAPADPTKYIGTVADCGDPKLNAHHHNACLGLRNLRLKTLEQTEAILVKIDARRTELKNLISEAKKAKEEAGILQRYEFELQGLQAHMQNDAMQLQALRDGYQQREKMYEMQMAEARRATDTRPPNGAVSFGAVPFVKPPKNW